MDRLFVVVSVKVEEDYRLNVVFEDGLEHTFDIASYLYKKPFCKLKDKRVFREARVGYGRVGYGTVVWPRGIDIAPETLRES